MQGAVERFVNEMDAQCQRVVDDLASEFLRRSPEELAKQPDYGSITRQMDGNNVEVAFWHYQLKDYTEHIVFIIDRRLLIPFLYRRFISGVVFGPTTSPRLMTDDEAEAYD
jgi:hypothetical protein